MIQLLAWSGAVGRARAFSCVALACVAFTSVGAHLSAVSAQTQNARAQNVRAQNARAQITGYDCANPANIANAHVTWTDSTEALRWGEWRIQLGANRIPVRVVVLVATPGATALALDIARDGNNLEPWTLDKAPANARFALNAGQFTDDGPWGWVVHRGREQQAPGTGSLAGALVVDNTGTWSLLDASEIARKRSDGTIREAVQSYPTLLGARGISGAVPQSLCANRGDAGHSDVNRSDANRSNVNLTHRDTRLAAGTTASGHLLIAMTRFDGLGSAADRLPIGPTTPEMISIMQALGATRALMLDGGLSAQLRIAQLRIAQQRVQAGAGSAVRNWPGLRAVPLALVGMPVPPR